MKRCITASLFLLVSTGANGAADDTNYHEHETYLWQCKSLGIKDLVVDESGRSSFKETMPYPTAIDFDLELKMTNDGHPDEAGYNVHYDLHDVSRDGKSTTSRLHTSDSRGGIRTLARWSDQKQRQMKSLVQIMTSYWLNEATKISPLKDGSWHFTQTRAPGPFEENEERRSASHLSETDDVVQFESANCRLVKHEL